MKTIELLQKEKKYLQKELKEILPSTRKEEIIDRILEIEKEILRPVWEKSILSYS